MPNACQILDIIHSSNYPFPFTLLPITLTLPFSIFPFHFPYYPFVYGYTVYLSTLYTVCILVYRAHGCLGAASVPPGHPPRAPGAPPWGGVPAQSLQPDPWPTLLVFASGFRSILMSVLGGLGVDLGSLLGVIFAPLGALVGLSWSQNRLRTVLSSKK